MHQVSKLLSTLLLCTFYCTFITAGNLNVKKIAKKYNPNDVIHSLIMYYEDAPSKKSKKVAQYIYDNDYSDVSYGKIKEYAQLAHNDTSIEEFFFTILEEKKAQTISKLSNMSLGRIVNFYNLHGSEHDYLKEVLRNVYFRNLDSLDYHSLKTLYQAFHTTDLYAEIEVPYVKLRNSLLADIMAAFEPCFKSEKELLKQIEDVVRFEAKQYIDSGLPIIIHQLNVKEDRSMLKKIFKPEDIDNYSFEEYAIETINNVYDYEYIERLIKNRIVEYLSSSKEIRYMLVNQYFNAMQYNNIYISNRTLNYHLNWDVARQDISSIQTIKDFGTALTLGSIVLGFVPGMQWVALAADVADFAYGMGQDERINKAIEELANTIYLESSICLDMYIENIFAQLHKEQESTAQNIKNLFYEKF